LAGSSYGPPSYNPADAKTLIDKDGYVSTYIADAGWILYRVQAGNSPGGTLLVADDLEGTNAAFAAGWGNDGSYGYDVDVIPFPGKKWVKFVNNGNTNISKLTPKDFWAKPCWKTGGGAAVVVSAAFYPYKPLDAVYTEEFGLPDWDKAEDLTDEIWQDLQTNTKIKAYGVGYKFKRNGWLSFQKYTSEDRAHIYINTVPLATFVRTRGRCGSD
jgi:hypothetical protein